MEFKAFIFYSVVELNDNISRIKRYAYDTSNPPPHGGLIDISRNYNKSISHIEYMFLDEV